MDYERASRQLRNRLKRRGKQNITEEEVEILRKQSFKEGKRAGRAEVYEMLEKSSW